MEIGDGHCFAMSFSLSPFLPFFPPFVTHPSLSPVLFVLLPCTEYIQRSHTHTHTYVYTKCVPCFLSLRAPSSSSSFFSSLFSSASPSRPVRSSLLLVALNERVDSRATTYVCPDLKIVRLWSSRAERGGVPNEPEIRSQLRTRER